MDRNGPAQLGVMQEKLPVRELPCLRVPMKNPRLAEDFWGKGRTDMKKKLLAGTVLSICLLSSGLSACSSEDKTEKPSSENQLQSDYMEVDGILTKTEKGSFSVHDGLMYFTDYETQTSIPVCGKPNCRHLSVYEDEKTTCNAVCSSSYMFPYKEKLYRIESVDNREGKLIASHMDGRYVFFGRYVRIGSDFK